ncbi:MAG TPA: hypothetical protein VGL12_14855, partial [Roseiarcus sp.]
RGRHGLELPGAEGGVRPAWPADEPLYRPRLALLPHHQGRRDRPRPSDASGTGPPGRSPGVGVEHIGAYSPHSPSQDGVLPNALARGRSERTFGTLQDHLVKELALAGITEIEAANAFIRDVYLPTHNARFAVAPAEPGSGFTPIPGVDLGEILCVEEERQVGNDNCVSYRTLKLQIPESPMRPHFVKARVKVHVYADGSHAVFHGPRCIGRYNENGALKPPPDEKCAA